MKAVARGSLVLVVGVAAALTLAGCVNDKTTTPTSSPSASSGTTTPTATASPASTPVTIPCTSVLTAQQVYNYNPNFVTDSTYSPTAGTDAAQVATDQGVACGWVDETSGSVLAVGIAQPAASELATLKSTASSSASPVAVAAGATGYFSTAGGVGEFQIFTARYWIVISSADFGAGLDAQPTATVVVGNLANH